MGVASIQQRTKPSAPNLMLTPLKMPLASNLSTSNKRDDNAPPKTARHAADIHTHTRKYTVQDVRALHDTFCRADTVRPPFRRVHTAEKILL